MKTMGDMRPLRLIFTFCLATTVLIGFGSCGFMYGPYGSGPETGMMNWGRGPFGMIFTVILWGLAIVGLISILKGLLGKDAISDNSKDRGSSALEILEERYARGEINKEAFESMKKDIGKG